MSVSLRLSLSVYSVFFMILLLSATPVDAASPVRLSVTADSGSGIEQEIVDYVSARFDDSADVVLSTVNPDWYVKCRIVDNQDRVGGQIRYNGTVTIKTLDGQTVDTVSVQKYNQDFSTESGTPLNKRLVDSAAREVVNAISERAAIKIKQAVDIELQTRDQITHAESLAKEDKYEQAIDILKLVSQDSVHFKAVQQQIAQFAIEKKALELVHSAAIKAKQGKYVQAIALLKEVDIKSKRYKLSQQLSGRYRSLLIAHNRTKNLAKKNNNNADQAKPISH